MSRRRRKGLSPSLFPFLAVLVCTLGTLILLLALVAQNAEDSAQQRADAEAQNASALTEVAQLEADELIAYRDRQTDALDLQRSELAHLEDHLRRLREELSALKAEIQIAESDSSDRAKSDALRVQIAELDQKIAEEYAELEKLKEENTSRPPRFVIVPYRGSNGTQRRPIYVECTDEAIVLQPEGVRITAANLSGSLGPGNPIDAALRTIRQHWQTLDPGAAPPYPLLLIRPDGIHAYAACRMAMDAWDDQFGYELVPADMELAFPSPDSELKSKLIATIDDATRRSQARLTGGPPRNNRYASGVQPDSLRPGFGQGNNALGGSGADASAIGRPGSAGRSPSAPTGNTFASDAVTGNSENAGNPNFIGSQNTPAGPRSGDSSLPNLNGYGPSGVESQSGASMQMQSANRDPLNGANTELPPGSRNDDTGVRSGFSSSGIASEGQPGTGPNQRTESTPPSTWNGNSASRETSRNSSAAGAASQASGPQVNTLYGSGSSQASSSVATTTGSPLDQQGAQQSQGSLRTSSGGNGSSPAMSGQSSASSGSAGPSMQTSTPPQTFSEALKQRSQLQPEQLPRTRPPKLPNLSSANNWALPESMRSHRGPTVVREIRMDCTLQEFIVHANRESPPIRIAIRNGLVNQAVTELARVLHDIVSEWGPVMRGGQWEPVLSVRVAPNANSRYQQLEMLLRNSGVRLERRTQ